MKVLLDRRGLAGSILAALALLVATSLLTPGSSPSKPSAPAKLGLTKSSTPIDFSLVLRLPGEERLHRFLALVNDPGSTRYRDFISPAAFGRRYGLAAGAMHDLRRRLARGGVRVVARYPQRVALEVRAKTGVVNRLLGIRLFDFLDQRGRRFHAPRGKPSVPSRLKSAVSGVTGLNSKLPLRAPAHLVPAGGLTPTNAALAYDLDALHREGIRGQGQAMAIISFDTSIRSDISAYNGQYNLPETMLQRIRVNGGAATGQAGPGGQAEVDLDIEISHAIAPEAHILDYDAPTSGPQSPLGSILDRIVADGRADIVSDSWGACEPNVPAAQIERDNHSIEAAEAAGISVFVASGDTGAYDCQDRHPEDQRLAVDWPSASPGVIAVGGTSLSVGQKGGYAGESAWEGALSQSGSGGGQSTGFSRPRWQRAEGVQNRFSNGNRQVPDVAAAGDPATSWSVYDYGSLEEVGGTSAAAPFWAASMLLVSQYAQKQGLGRLGYVNPLLYRIASTPQPYEPFNDITFGSNRRYPATRGWDFATGLGSPNVYNLARDVVVDLKSHPGSG